MKAKSALIIACLSIALILVAGTTRAEAQCCWYNYVAAPFVAAGYVVEGAAVLAADIVTAPFAALSCGTCGVSLCNPCSAPKVTFVPNCHC